MVQKAVDDLDFLCGFILDQRACSRVSGVHGPAGVWEEARPDHHAQKTRYSGSSQKTYQGTCRFFTNIVLTPLEEKLWLSFHLELQLFERWHCLFCAAKKKTTDIYLQHLQPCQTGCRGRRRNRCILGVACGGTTSWRCKRDCHLTGFQVKLFIVCYFWKLWMFFSVSDCCVQVWSHQAEEEVFFFFQVFSDWVGQRLIWTWQSFGGGEILQT